MNFESMLRSAKEIKKDSKFIDQGEREMSLDCGKAWGVYDSDLDSYFNLETAFSFDVLIDPNELQKNIETLKEQGPVVGLDVMGQAQACSDLGCDVSLGITLPQGTISLDQKEFSEGRELLKGNIFESETINALFERLDEGAASKGEQLGLIFYRPVGGDKMYSNNEYAQKYLLHKVLVPLYERLAPGGRILLGLNNFHFELRSKMMDYLRDSYDDMQINNPSHDGRVMITKTA